MKQVIHCAPILLIVFIASVCAQDNALIAALKKKYHEKSSLELTFDCKIFWKVREKTEKKRGVLIIKAGDQFRLKLGSWEWVCDGQTYWQYNKKTSQVIIKSLLDVDLGMHPSQMMNTYLSYDFTVTSGNDKEAELSWTVPKQEQKNPYTHISLMVDKKKTVIKKLLAVDRKGNESTYTFVKTKTLAQIPPETFTFKVPKGVEVIDTRD